MRTVDGVTEVELPTELSVETIEAFDRREREAAVGAIRNVLAPSSVAVIGASRRPDAVGAILLAEPDRGRVQRGRVPDQPPRRGDPGISSATRRSPSCPRRSELAVVAVPAAEVAAVARDCAQAGVRALVVISAGFAETGPEGAARQHELLSGSAAHPGCG